jgi:hypothetical protein
MSIAFMHPKGWTVPPNSWAHRFANTTIHRPHESGFYGLGRHVTAATRHLYERLQQFTQVRGVVDQVVRYGEEQKVDMLWVVLNSTTNIAVAKGAAERLGVPLLTLVWDPPEYRLPMGWHLHGAAFKMYFDMFVEDLRASKRCAVMSENMQQHFEQLSGVECVLMRRGIDRREWIDQRDRESASDYVIGYAGTVYAMDEWRALLAGLDRAEWKIRGRDVTIRIYSGQYDARASNPVRIDFRGWHSTHDTINALNNTDVCYISHWLDMKFRPASRMSFPSKLSAYFAAGTPILYHGPRDSSTTPFLERYPNGTTCDSLEPTEIIRTLEQFADLDFRKRARAALSRAREEELGLHVFRDRFATFVGVDEKELLPLT